MACLRAAWIALALFVSTSVAVEHTNFKRCDQSGFCRRNRLQEGESREPKYGVDPKTVEVLPAHLAATLVDSSIGLRLGMEFTAMNSGTVRLRIYETNPAKPRYEPPEIILPFEGQSWEEVAKDDKEVMGQVVGTNHKVRIHYDPFLAEILDGNTVLMSINSRNLMQFEPMTPKPEPLPEPPRDANGVYIDAEAEAAWRKRNEELQRFKPEMFKHFSDSKPNGYTSVAMDVTFHDFNHIYGLPSHADTVALKTTVTTDPYRLYNLDVFEFELYNPMALYGSIPMVLAHAAAHTVGMFWLNASETWVDIIDTIVNGSKAGKSTHWISESGIIDVFFFYGPTPEDVIRQYTRLTGTAALPPLFSLGYHQCRWNYNSVEDCLTVNAKFDEYNMPYDVLWLDIEHTNDKRYFTWQPANFKDALHLQYELGNKSRKLVNIVDPHIKRDMGFYVHKEASEKDYYVKSVSGSVFEGWCWPGSSSWPDFTRRDVREFWASKFALDSYESSTPNLHIWNDMNEPSVFNGPEFTLPKDTLHADGFEHRDVHNLYGQLVHRASAEGMYNRSGGKERPFVLSRAFFAGSQRYGAVWTGDVAANWEYMRSATQMLLSAGVAGLSFTGADVGGFIGNSEPELFTRWFQAGIFYPFFRAHSHIDSNRREPWCYTEDVMDRVRTALKLRYQMLPIWYTAFYFSHMKGSPVIKPLWWQYTQDERTFDMDDGYLVGTDILVNPVYDKGATTKQIYFPAQTWYNLITDEMVVGPQSLEFPVDMDTITAFQRGGSIIPLQMRPRRSSPLQLNDPYTLRVALDNNSTAHGFLYMDDGTTYKHMDGHFALRAFHYEGNVLRSVSADEKGVLEPANRLERVIVLGLSTTPTKVTVSDSKGERTLPFRFDTDKQVLTIKDPAVPVASDWSIELH